jgi:hypothetical protein
MLPVAQEINKVRTDRWRWRRCRGSRQSKQARHRTATVIVKKEKKRSIISEHKMAEHSGVSITERGAALIREGKGRIARKLNASVCTTPPDSAGWSEFHWALEQTITTRNVPWTEGFVHLLAYKTLDFGLKVKSIRIYRVFQRSFKTVFLMLLCGEC